MVPGGQRTGVRALPPKFESWGGHSGSLWHQNQKCSVPMPDKTNDVPTQRTSIVNANGVTYPDPVIGVGTITLSPSLSLSNILLVSSLSNRLMFTGQATKELNCVVLIYLIYDFFRIFSPLRSLSKVLRNMHCNSLIFTK